MVKESVNHYDVYNDLSVPDLVLSLARPVLGGDEHPYPRRCRTGRVMSCKDPLTESRTLLPFYVPIDEDFSEIKDVIFGARTLYSVLHGVMPILDLVVTDKDKINVDKHQVKPAIKAQHDQQIDDDLLAEARFCSDVEVTEKEIECMVMEASRVEYIANDKFNHQLGRRESSTPEPSYSGGMRARVKKGQCYAAVCIWYCQWGSAMCRQWRLAAYLVMMLIPWFVIFLKPTADVKARLPTKEDGAKDEDAGLDMLYSKSGDWHWLVTDTPFVAYAAGIGD
ncbi:linoleate 13S-lipoxygenase 2-1, chloroplastic-like protein [Tanacetum coccineum]